jgi:hypothetical protein
MEPFYVGKGKGNRVNYHKRRSDVSPMTHRLALMKREKIEPDIKVIQAIDEDHAFFLESCLIEIVGRRDMKSGTLLNMTDGGDGASNLSPESRGKISKARKGKGLSPEHRVKLSEAKMGVKRGPHSDETKAKISQSNKGKVCAPISNETRKKMSDAHKGKKLSLDHITKLITANTGKKASPCARRRMSDAHKGKKRGAHTPEAIAKISAAHKLIQQRRRDQS